MKIINFKELYRSFIMGSTYWRLKLYREEEEAHVTLLYDKPRVKSVNEVGQYRKLFRKEVQQSMEMIR